MLRQLHIRDFALVRSLEIALNPGLTVITGESGAGKSILLGAIGMVTGDRADTNNIRPGAGRSEVAAEFLLAGHSEAMAFLTERDLIDQDQPDRCLLRRVLSREGRSRAFINGSPVTRQELAAFTASLIDIHGQHEHQSLLRTGVQLALLDDFAAHIDLVETVRVSYRAWQQSQRELNALRNQLDQAADRHALLAYQVAELEDIALAPGEFERLDARFRRLAKSQDIQLEVARAIGTLEGDDASSVSTLHQLARGLGDIRDDHPALAAARELAQGALAQLDEATGELRRYLDALVSEPDELAALEDRLDRATTLARKHRVRPEQLPFLQAELTAELAALAVDGDQLAALERRAKAHAADYRSHAGQLSERRRDAATAYERAISDHLDRLGIRGGRLELAFGRQESETGFDTVEYRVVTNPKYPAAPLARIASGGELSRISLAIQVVAAARSRMPTLVLDEADVGIGGTTADIVGRMLRQIAAQCQVLCVTHAPQVAALGEHHLSVEKDPEQDTRIDTLDADARLAELARMLGGRRVTDKTREYAREMIAAAAMPAARNGSG
jgi:DNA repair protein RecN (Recombination protein N)